MTTEIDPHYVVAELVKDLGPKWRVGEPLNMEQKAAGSLLSAAFQLSNELRQLKYQIHEERHAVPLTVEDLLVRATEKAQTTEDYLAVATWRYKAGAKVIANITLAEWHTVNEVFRKIDELDAGLGEELREAFNELTKGALRVVKETDQ